MESCNVFLTFESVDEILRCNISNKISPAVILHGSIFFLLKFDFSTFESERINLSTKDHLFSSPKLLSWRTSSLVFSPFGKSCYKILNLDQLMAGSLPLKSVIESLWCYRSKETSLAELFYSTNYFL